MTVEPLRVLFRRQLRGQALGVARSLAVERGWAKVRMGEVAALTGVSRPTLYKEFGDKQALGEAVMFEEAERFVAKVADILERENDFEQALIEAVHFALEEAGRSPLLHSVLTSTPRNDSGLLPLLTTKSAPIVVMASDVFLEWLKGRLPDVTPGDLSDLADILVRLTVSHLLLPVADSVETAWKVTQVAVRYLGRQECCQVELAGFDGGA